METLNQKINLEIEVLTPLSIGAGADKDWVRGVDFVVGSNGMLYKLNMRKMLKAGINPIDLSNYFAKKDEEGIINRLAGHLEEVSDFAIPMPVQSDNDVKTMLKNQLTGNPIIAGSSLKGAIRSVLFQHLGGASKDGKEVFGTSKDGDEFMRFIKLSDAEFDGTALVNTKIFNLQMTGSGRGGWKHGAKQTDSHFRPTGFNTLYECLMPNQKSYASLMMTETLFNLYELKGKPHIKSGQKRQVLHDVSQLFDIINNHTMNYLKKERAFFCQYETERTEEIVRSIDALLGQIPQDNSYCILKMSAGSGFHSITGDWQLDNYFIDGVDTGGKVSRGTLKGKKSAKSRKIAVWDDHFSLMGFVKLRIVSDDEMEQARIAVVQRNEAIKQARLEEERMRLEAEKQAKEAQRERENRYKLLMDQGEKFAMEGRIEDALLNYREANAIFAKDEVSGIISGLQEKLETKQREDELNALREQEAAQRQQAYAVPLAEKIANAGKFPTLFGNVKSWMKNNGVEVLSDADRKVLYDKIKSLVGAMKPKEREKMRGFGGDLDALVGDDTAMKWFEEIVKQTS